MAQVEARDTSRHSVFTGMASGQSDRDPRGAFLPLVEGKEGAVGEGNGTDEHMARRTAEESSRSTRVAVGRQEEDGLCHRLNCVPMKDLLKF